MADTTNESTPATPRPDYHETLPEFLQSAGILLTNIQSTAVWDKVKNKGYALADITGAQTRLEALRTLDEKQKKEYGEQFGATEDYNSAKNALYNDYIEHLGYARLAFKNDTAAQTALGLGGKRKVSQSGFAAQGRLFYDNALGKQAWKDALAAREIDGATLTAMLAGFNNLDALSAAQKKETGEAQEATKKRDAEFDDLHEWVHDLRETAKLALRKFPQMLEQVGIKDPS